MRDHPWFKNYDWTSLEKKLTPPPFVPPNEDNFDVKYINADWKDNNSEQMRQHSQMLKRGSVQALFQGYYHDENMAGINNDKSKGVQNIKEYDSPSPTNSNKETRGNSSSFGKEST